MSKPFSSAGTLTLDTELTFGKFEGCSIYDVMSEDPTYIAWLYVDAKKPFNEEVKQLLVSRLLELIPKKSPYNSRKPLYLPNNYSEWDDDIPF